MIYEFPEVEAPLRQGDIFVSLPRVDMSLREFTVLESEGLFETEWIDAIRDRDEIIAAFPVKAVAAIIITQDCDAARSEDVTLCEIQPFRIVEGKAAQAQKVKSWVSLITQQARLNQKWFYLPPCEEIGFKEKLAVDFRMTLRIPRVELEQVKHLRRGRLNEVADEHFRERIAEFFRRYPYDEWYPLNTEEFAEYKNRYEDVSPFPWQR